jgi:hypothetical protein
MAVAKKKPGCRLTATSQRIEPKLSAVRAKDTTDSGPTRRKRVAIGAQAGTGSPAVSSGRTGADDRTGT